MEPLYFAGLTSSLCLIQRIFTPVVIPEEERMHFATEKWILEGTLARTQIPSPPQNPILYHVLYTKRYNQIRYPEIVKDVREALETCVEVEPEQPTEAPHEQLPLHNFTHLMIGGTEIAPTLYGLLAGKKINVGQMKFGKRKNDKTAGGWPLYEVIRPAVVGVAQVVLQEGRLKIPDDLQNADTLKQQLRTMELEKTEQPEDLSLALALALWYAEKRGGGPRIRSL